MESMEKELHPAFSDFFTPEELKEVFEKACIRSYEELVIINEKYLFELYLCCDDDISIVCKPMDIENYAALLDKELFFKKLLAYPLAEVKSYDVS